jgi:hypothetical protein
VIAFCSLNPLKYCRPDLAFYFSNFLLHLKLFDCTAVIEANTLMSCSSSLSALSTSINQLNSMLVTSGFDFLLFSPFQPYNLPLCRQRLMTQYLYLRAVPEASFNKDKQLISPTSKLAGLRLSESQGGSHSEKKRSLRFFQDSDNLGTELATKDPSGETLPGLLNEDDSDQSLSDSESDSVNLSSASAMSHSAASSSDSLLGKRPRGSSAQATRANMLRVCLSNLLRIIA